MTRLQQSLGKSEQRATPCVIEKGDQARPDLISSDISKPVWHKPNTFSVNMSQQQKTVNKPKVSQRHCAPNEREVNHQLPSHLGDSTLEIYPFVAPSPN